MKAEQGSGQPSGLEGEMVGRVKAAVVRAVEQSAEPSLIAAHRPGEEYGKGLYRFDGFYNPAVLARAAIEAMREPTEAMIDAGGETPTGWEFTTGDAITVWQAMISAALSSS